MSEVHVRSRRAEEEHMRRVTRVKPSKNPRGGGYVYMNVDTGVMVSSHAYEPSYLAEVAFMSDYVANATLEAWQREASARLEEMEPGVLLASRRSPGMS